jgi:hypothetical protein
MTWVTTPLELTVPEAGVNLAGVVGVVGVVVVF